MLLLSSNFILERVKILLDLEMCHFFKSRGCSALAHDVSDLDLVEGFLSGFLQRAVFYVSQIYA